MRRQLPVMPEVEHQPRVIADELADPSTKKAMHRGP